MESLIPNTGETSAEKHLGQTLHHNSRGSNREGTEPNLGTAERVPMSRGDKETQEVSTTEDHNGTYPEQSRPAVQHFVRRRHQNLVPSLRNEKKKTQTVSFILCTF